MAGRHLAHAGNDAPHHARPRPAAPRQAPCRRLHDFEDELGELTPAELKGMDIGTDRTKFERKVRTYLRSHETT